MDAKTNRVFFHELGHFVAHELNAAHHNGYEVKSIYIMPCDQQPDEMCGGTDFELGEKLNISQNAAPPIERLPQYLAGIIHGCIFQCYYNKTDFGDCFKVHGCSDLKYWSGGIDENKLLGTKPQFSRIEADYYKMLLDKNVLDGFIKLNPDYYVDEVAPNSYHVDVTRLRDDTKCLLNEYYKSYKQLIDNYHSLIEKLKGQQP